MKTLILVLCILLAGCSDYEEEVRAEDHYCEMVKLDFWPAYNSEIKCNEVASHE